MRKLDFRHQDSKILWKTAATGEDVFSLEAMACGLPLVTSNAPFYLNYIGGEKVYLVKPTSEHIREGIKRVLSDQSLYAQISSYSRLFAMEKFSWESRIEQYRNIYCRLTAITPRS